jgi:hypothetical protein
MEQKPRPPSPRSPQHTKFAKSLRHPEASRQRSAIGANARIRSPPANRAENDKMLHVGATAEPSGEFRDYEAEAAVQAQRVARAESAAAPQPEALPAMVETTSNGGATANSGGTLAAGGSPTSGGAIATGGTSASGGTTGNGGGVGQYVVAIVQSSKAQASDITQDDIKDACWRRHCSGRGAGLHPQRPDRRAQAEHRDAVRGHDGYHRDGSDGERGLNRLASGQGRG